MKFCQTCSSPAPFYCGGCGVVAYCSSNCFKFDWKSNHSFECIGLKLKREREELLQNVTNVEDARRLVNEGADPYEYIGNGKVALDNMAKHFPIREFLIENKEKTPKFVEEMIAKAQHVMATEGKSTFSFEKEGLDVKTMKHLIFNGFIPSANDIDSVIFEHIFFNRYNFETLKYWDHSAVFKLTDEPITYTYANNEYYYENTSKSPESFPLILFFPHLVYKESRRAKTSMKLFKTVHSNILENAPLKSSKNFIPVTRYAIGMSGGLFHKNDETSEYCGTFYYYEPESTTFLKVENVLEAFDKDDAEDKLGGCGDSSVEFITDRYDLLVTPTELVQYENQRYRRKDKVPEGVQDRKFYLPNSSSLGYDGMYAFQDSLDQPICISAKEQGYDAIILYNMVGSRQIVKEVLDVRSRDESFRNLYFLKE